MSAKKVTTASFTQDVEQSARPTLVDFYADWCGPCRAMSPVVDELAAELPDANVVKVNVDDSPELAVRFKVESIPTFVVLRQGGSPRKFVGIQSKQDLKTALVG